MISFMLDSNVWEKAICPDDYPDGEDYRELNKKIMSATGVEFYLSATIFDLEDIRRKDRLVELKAYNPSFKTEIKQDGDIINMRFTIGPSSFPYKQNPKLSKHAMMAFNTGFKVVASSRVGIPINPLREQSTIDLTNEQNEKISEVSEFIEQLGSGMASLNSVLTKYGIKKGNLLSMIKALPQDAIKPFSDAVSEWADGDTVAACIGMDIDYLVTNDMAGKAGSKSIFYKDNIQKLISKYPQFKIITPSGMLSLL